MRKYKFFWVFVLLVLLLSAGLGAGAAQKPVLDAVPVDPAIQEAARANAMVAEENGIPPIDDAVRQTIQKWRKEVAQERARLEPPTWENGSLGQGELGETAQNPLQGAVPVDPAIQEAARANAVVAEENGIPPNQVG